MLWHRDVRTLKHADCGLKRKRKTTHVLISYLNQLHEVFTEQLIINRELAVVVDDAVVLHLAIAAYAQSVVPGEVGALSHQEHAFFRGVKQPLCLIPCYLPMEPSASGGSRDQRDSVTNSNLILNNFPIHSAPD